MYIVQVDHELIVSLLPPLIGILGLAANKNVPVHTGGLRTEVYFPVLLEAGTQNQSLSKAGFWWGLNSSNQCPSRKRKRQKSTHVR